MNEITFVLSLLGGLIAMIVGIIVVKGFMEGVPSEEKLTKDERTLVFHVAGEAISCTHCGNNHFRDRRSQLNTWIASAMDFDFLNRSATTLICTKCGKIQWFNQKVTR